MSEIRPFHAWRYDPAIAGDPRLLIAPPYDVISPAGQRALYESSPFNIIRLELTAREPFDPAGEAGDAARHARARSTLDAWLSSGVLREDSAPAFYLYEQRFRYGDQWHSRRSLLVAARLHPWSAERILPHEHTLARPRAERLALLRATRANISPIWSLYSDPTASIATALLPHAQAEPALQVEDGDGITHLLWVIDDTPTIESVTSAIAAGPLFIADGHHRYETALAYRDEISGGTAHPAADYVLMALTAADDPGLVVLPTHRLIGKLPAARLAALPDMLARYFLVEEVDVPPASTFAARLAALLPAYTPGTTEHRFALLGPEADRLRVLRPRALSLAGTPPSPALGELDVWLAHALVLERCLGLDSASMERQEHVEYTRDPADARESVRNGTHQLALFLAPTPVEQLLTVARAGAVMPQKSTYFFPKLATGLVLRLLY